MSKVWAQAQADILDQVTQQNEAEAMVLRVEHLDVARCLTVEDEGAMVRSLEVHVAHWEWPHRLWRGQVGQILGLIGYDVTLPARNWGPARAQISLSLTTSLREVMAALYPLLGLDSPRTGYGLPQIALIDAPPRSLALFGSRVAPQPHHLPSAQLAGVGLALSDIGLAGSRSTAATLQALAEDPETITVAEPLVVTPDGHLAVSQRQGWPLVDLNVHNPVGRISSHRRPRGSLVATVEGNGRDAVLHLSPAPGTGGTQVVRRSLNEPLGALEVASLRDIEAIDLSGLAARDEDTAVALTHRMTELAATGVILHSLPQPSTAAAKVLGPTLTELLSAPYTPASGLQRELRTVPQRREAMWRFGGFFELADAVARSGGRLLPSVSALVSSMRPERLIAVLNALAAQDYPHLEVVVALHGVSGDPGPEFAEAVRRSEATVIRREASTPFGAVLADAARHSSGDLVVKIDDDDVYGPHVISDLVLAQIYSNAELVGKTTEYLYFEEIDHTVHRRFNTESYDYQVAGGAMLLQRSTLLEIGGWRATPHSTDRSILIRLGNVGGIGYRTTSLGYVYIRHDDGHTWKRSDSLLLNGAYEQWPRFMPEIVESLTGVPHCQSR